MVCTIITLPGGGRMIACGTQRPPARCSCGAPAPLLCDWKVAAGTCDAPICEACATKPARDKDLCPSHAVAWEAWRAAR